MRRVNRCSCGGCTLLREPLWPLKVGDPDHYRCGSSFSLLQRMWPTISTRPLLSPRAKSGLPIRSLPALPHRAKLPCAKPVAAAPLSACGQNAGPIDRRGHRLSLTKCRRSPCFSILWLEQQITRGAYFSARFELPTCMNWDITVKLLLRTKRTVQLTAAGSVFLRVAEQILNHAKEAGQIARRAARGETGSLGIGFFGTASGPFLPSLVQAKIS